MNPPKSQQSQTQVVSSTSRTPSSNPSKASSSSSNLILGREKKKNWKRKEREESGGRAKTKRRQREKLPKDKLKRSFKFSASPSKVNRLLNNGESSSRRNIAPAQKAAVEQITDQIKKALQHQINLVQNAIQQRAEQARQRGREKQHLQQEETVAASGYFRDKGQMASTNGQYASKKEIAEQDCLGKIHLYNILKEK